jgi:hypothetical protein
MGWKAPSDVLLEAPGSFEVRSVLATRNADEGIRIWSWSAPSDVLVRALDPGDPFDAKNHKDLPTS